MRCDSSSNKRFSAAPESTSSVLYTTPAGDWHWVRWCETCVQLVGHRNPFQEAPHIICVLMVLLEAVWTSVVTDATDEGPVLLACLSLCGVQICSWVAVASNCFHFVITASTVDGGKCSIWHPLKSRSFMANSKCLSLEIPRLCPGFLASFWLKHLNSTPYMGFQWFFWPYSGPNYIFGR